MPEFNPLVCINSDSAEDIKCLYGISQKLAERIVNHRNAGFYFRCPEDLAKVEGVSLALSLTLAPHIDWRLPCKPETRKERSFIPAIFALFGLAAVIWYIFSKQLPNYYYSLDQFLMRPRDAWFVFLQEIALLISIFTGAIILLSILIQSLSRSLKSTNRINNAYSTLFVVMVFFILVSYVARTIIFALNNVEQDLLNNRFFIRGIIAIVESLLLAAPFILVRWRPNLANNPYLTRGFDIVITLASGFLVFYVWWYPIDRSMENYISYIFAGSLFAILGLYSLFGSRSLIFEFAVKYFRAEKVNESSGWKTWVNSHVPDPEKQIELKSALEEMHPPSRLNKFASTIFIVVEGWLILTALSAIVEWLINNTLNKLIR